MKRFTSEMKIETKNGNFIIKSGDKTAFMQSISSMIRYSVKRPYQTDICNWDMKADGDIFVLTDDRLRVDINTEITSGCIKLNIKYTNISSDMIKDLMVGLFLDCESGIKHKQTLPHIIYNDNPSADPDRLVGHIGTEDGKGVVVEEHRLPIPAVNIEWYDDEYYALTLLMCPEVKRGYSDEYWSMGIVRKNEGEEIQAMSGPLMFNGLKDVYYGGRNTNLPYLSGYRNLDKKESLSKTFYISLNKTSEGRGFRNMINLAYDILKPDQKRLYTHEQMVNFKKNVMDSRYYEDEVSCGYLTFGKANTFGSASGRPEYYLYGWTGQAIKLAWCDYYIGKQNKEEFRVKRAINTVDFYVKNGEWKDTKGLLLGYYMIDAREMRPEHRSMDAPVSSRIEGEALIDLFDLMELMITNNDKISDEWISFAQRAVDFLSSSKALTIEGIYPVGWDKSGKPAMELTNSAGISCVNALAKAGMFFKNKKYYDKALEIYEKYFDIHMKTFERPFARATMDAKCEDKESCIYFFKAAEYFYKISGDIRFKEDASVAADWLLSFVYFWETGFQPGTACDNMNFKSLGWPGVSVQNHHLDVFFPTFELYEFGKLSEQEFYCRMAECVSAAHTYGVAAQVGDYDYSVIGEQGEQYYQTNYFQVKYPKILELTQFYRGGMQVWNPSWITAQVLQSSLLFIQYDK